MDYVEILQEYGVKYERKEDKLEVKCPFGGHSDNTPSGAIFLDSGNFHCLGCGNSSSLYRFLGAITNQTPNTVYFDIQKRYPEKEDRIIPQTNVERFHGALWKNEELLKNVRARGISDKTIRERKLGSNVGRIQIPILNSHGYTVNLRQHKPGAKKDKVVNQRKFGKPIRWYPIDQFAYDELVVTGGELKALRGLQELNKHGIGCITGTWGEANWTNDLLVKLKGYVVYVCMDIDEAGQNAANKMCGDLHAMGGVIRIHNVRLPLDIKEFPKGDLNDFKGDLLEVIKESPVWQAEESVEEEFKSDTPPEQVTLAASTHAKFAKQRLQLRGLVSAVEEAPFPVPKKVEVVCPREGKPCAACRVYRRYSADNQKITLEPENPSLLQVIGASSREQPRILKEAFKIPSVCNKVSFEVEDYHNIEHICLASEPDLRSRDEEKTIQSAYCVGDGITLNAVHEFEGRMFPHPRSQQATLLLSNYEVVDDVLDTYETKDAKHLEIFRPKEWTKEGIKAKLDEIYTDLEANVTRIFKRRELHLTVDLAYHSPLWYDFDEIEQKGWVQVLIVGDSSQGKSDTVEFLHQHYGLGEIIDCDGATVAGIIGGVAKFGDRNFVAWGAMVQNDRRILIMEELKGASTEVISKWKETRSSGWATLTKIEKKRTRARTRLICLSNPRGKTSMSGYNYGVNAVLELVGSPEDVRRFDMVLAVDRNEVDIEDLQGKRPKVDHFYSADLCRELVLYCWTCKRVHFEDEQPVFEASRRLCKKFTDEIPIVDRGSMRFKLAKLSAALAGRTFSTDEAGGIIVRPCHVEFIEDFLDSQYSKSTFGYAEYSKVQFEAEVLTDEAKVQNHIAFEIEKSELFINAMLQEDLIDSDFLQNLLAWDHDTSRRLMSYLIANRALRRNGRAYRKTIGFTQLLKTMQQNGVPKPDLPAHLKGKY